MEGENITNEFLAFRESPWTSNGSNIYLQTGSVGIGTLAPRATLDVYGSINALSANFGTIYTGGTVFTSMNVSGDSNLQGNVIVNPGRTVQVGNLIASNLIVTGNFLNVTTNVQISNSVSINNAGTSTALIVHQIENTPVHTNNVAEFWDYQTLALLINGDGNVGIHTTVIDPYAFAVVGTSNLDYINTINLYSSNAVVTSNLYGRLVGSNTVSASTIYGTLAGSNSITGSSVSATTIYGTLAGANTVSASGLYGPVVGSNTVAASIIYGQLAGANTVTGSIISGTTLYGQLAGSNAIAGSSVSATSVTGTNIIGTTAIYGTILGSNTIAASSLTLGTALGVANGGTGVTSSTGTGSVVLSASPTLSGTISGGTFSGTHSGSGASLTNLPLNQFSGLTSGGIVYGTATTTIATSTSLLWDSTNSRMGIGTSTIPAYAIDVFDQNNSMMRLSQYNSTDGPVIRSYRALGTFAVPTGVTADTVLFASRGFGYNSSAAFSGRCVGLEMCAAETFTSTATGTYIRFDTCATGTITNSEKMRLTGSGYLGIGVTPTSPLHVVSSQTTQSRIVILDGSGQSTIDTGILINSGTGKNPYIDFQQAGVLKCNMYWDNGSSRMVHNGQTTNNYFAGNLGIKKTPTVELDIAGSLKTSTNSTNYVVGTGTAVTINTTTPTTVASVTITTVGKPVFIICCGDLQPVSAAPTGDWCNMRLYQGASTQIGLATLYHPGTAASTNHMFSIHAIDVPAAGTYTYTCKAWQGTGSIQFGEIGVPYIVAWEFI